MEYLSNIVMKGCTAMLMYLDIEVWVRRRYLYLDIVAL